MGQVLREPWLWKALIDAPGQIIGEQGLKQAQILEFNRKENSCLLSDGFNTIECAISPEVIQVQLGGPGPGAPPVEGILVDCKKAKFKLNHDNSGFMMCLLDFENMGGNCNAHKRPTDIHTRPEVLECLSDIQEDENIIPLTQQARHDEMTVFGLPPSQDAISYKPASQSAPSQAVHRVSAAGVHAGGARNTKEAGGVFQEAEEDIELVDAESPEEEEEEEEEVAVVDEGAEGCEGGEWDAETQQPASQYFDESQTQQPESQYLDIVGTAQHGIDEGEDGSQPATQAFTQGGLSQSQRWGIPTALRPQQHGGSNGAGSKSKGVSFQGDEGEEEVEEEWKEEREEKDEEREGREEGPHTPDLDSQPEEEEQEDMPSPVIKKAGKALLPGGKLTPATVERNSQSGNSQSQEESNAREARKGSLETQMDEAALEEGAGDEERSGEEEEEEEGGGVDEFALSQVPSGYADADGAGAGMHPMLAEMHKKMNLIALEKRLFRGEELKRRAWERLKKKDPIVHWKEGRLEDVLSFEDELEGIKMGIKKRKLLEMEEGAVRLDSPAVQMQQDAAMGQQESQAV